MNNPSDNIESIDPFKDPSVEHTSPWNSQFENTNQDVISAPENSTLGLQQPEMQEEGICNSITQEGNTSNNQQTVVENIERVKSGSSYDTKEPHKKKLQFTLKTITCKNNQTCIYRFDVSTNFPEYKRRKYFGIERTHAEFNKLSKHLAISYPLCLALSFPCVENFIINDPDIETAVHTFVQTWLDWVSFHNILQNDYELRKFVEAPFIFNPSAVITSISKSKFEIEYEKFSKSSFSFFQGWSGNSKKASAVSIKSDDITDSYNRSSLTPDEKFQLYGKEFNTVSRPLNNARIRLIALQTKTRQAACAILDLSSQITSLGNIDLGKQSKLASSLLSLGQSEKSISSTQTLISAVEGTQPRFYLSNLEKGGLDIQRSLVNRVIIFSEYYEAKQSHDRKKQAVNILRSSSTIASKAVDDTLKSMEEAKNVETELRNKAEQVDRTLNIDIKKYKAVRHGLLTQVLRSWATSQLSLERQILEEYKVCLKMVQQSSADSLNHIRKTRFSVEGNTNNSIPADPNNPLNSYISSYSASHFSPKLSSSITPGISSIFSS
ncbi:hypothetical protein BB561_000969 [Smittium simulii]|uniref:PX domain-containing protein n=1 Tax=Smittium simulii TaxID=133385 RepID=A0A2T9YWS8_9FUNG|nr:hypothetical protein BB561_000969 [Smittium simulii]